MRDRVASFTADVRFLSNSHPLGPGGLCSPFNRSPLQSVVWTVTPRASKAVRAAPGAWSVTQS
ncbi:hypothetical protein GCM10008959_17550 [Deinococcus seoulensis]|uniref:Uncharacterized protein n=1 Tax=Deinococcus seoulensis TaxID=1837379 RepID=A0ABQ2RS68_9DEIO|nr:hypothetical protein GCM10008959_17550 [Deinococcus seoulensis]